MCTSVMQSYHSIKLHTNHTKKLQAHSKSSLILKENISSKLYSSKTVKEITAK